MRGLLSFYCFWIFLSATCEASSLNRFMSPEELIAFETIQILRTASDNYAVLSERHLSRAESYLLHGDYELAVADFQKGYAIADL